MPSQVSFLIFEGVSSVARKTDVRWKDFTVVTSQSNSFKVIFSSVFKI